MVEVRAQHSDIEPVSDEQEEGDPAAPILPQANLPQADDLRELEDAQRAQLGELEAKLTEDRHAAQNFRIGLDGDQEHRGDRAREAGRLARARINDTTMSSTP